MSSEFRARLARLRREELPEDVESDATNGGAGDPPLQDATAPARAPLPSWLRSKLDRRAPSTSVAVDNVVGAAPTLPEPADLAPLSHEPPADLVEVLGDAGAFALRRIEYALDHRHGAFTLDELFTADCAAFELATGDPRLGALDLRRAVFLDTETTGLSGGAGTTVFLVGLGWFEDARFVLWQGFLRSPAEERALLAATAERLGSSSGLVSFFGKSFDRHRLEDKMRVHRVAPPFAELAHLDLYHPLRRLYGAASPDGRLRTMESTLCGLERVGDLPGSRAPEAWFDFLAGRPHRLEGVFRHNAEDVLSLVTLAAHLGRVTTETRGDGSPLEGCRCARAAALAQLCNSRRDYDGARRWYEQHIERTADPRSSAVRASRYALAELHRRAGEDELAEALHTELANDPLDAGSVRALIALSMLAEHRRRDRGSALELAQRARALVDSVAVGPEHARLARDLDARQTRLRRHP